MDQVLSNLALFMLVDFCKANNINCAGTHVEKDGRGFAYSLRDSQQQQVATIRFNKSQRPSFWTYKPLETA